MQKANVYLRERLAGVLEQRDRGYAFTYTAAYLSSDDVEEVALSLPLQSKPFETDHHLPPFFDGLIPEGWMLQLAIREFGVKPTDRFALLLATARTPIGAVRIAAHDA